MSYPAALFTLASLLTNSDSRFPVDVAWPIVNLFFEIPLCLLLYFNVAYCSWWFY
jgi:hypothetical protein